MAANTMKEAISAIQKADNGKYDYADMKSSNKNIQAIHDAKNEELKSERVKEIEKQRKGEVVYTLFASGLNHGGRNVLLDDADFTSNIVIIFDAVPSHTYTRTVEKTSFATENRVEFSDHAVIKDGTFSFSAYINTSPTHIINKNYLDKDTNPKDPAGSLRPGKTLEVLEKLIEDRQLVNLATEDKMLENYIITKLTAKRDVGEGAALLFEIELTEFRTFSLYKTVNATVSATASSDPKKSSPKNKGAVDSSSKKFKDQEKFTAEKTMLYDKDNQNFAKGAAWEKHTFQDREAGYVGRDGTITDMNGKKISYQDAMDPYKADYSDGSLGNAVDPDTYGK